MLRLAPCLMESLKELVGLGGTGTRDSEGKQGWMSPSSDHTRGEEAMSRRVMAHSGAAR